MEYEIGSLTRNKLGLTFAEIKGKLYELISKGH